MMDQAWRGRTGASLATSFAPSLLSEMWDLFVRADEAVTLPARSLISVSLTPI